VWAGNLSIKLVASSLSNDPESTFVNLGLFSLYNWMFVSIGLHLPCLTCVKNGAVTPCLIFFIFLVQYHDAFVKCRI
jgi:hypothetical protein